MRRVSDHLLKRLKVFAKFVLFRSGIRKLMNLIETVTSKKNTKPLSKLAVIYL